MHSLPFKATFGPLQSLRRGIARAANEADSGEAHRAGPGLLLLDLLLLKPRAPIFGDVPARLEDFLRHVRSCPARSNGPSPVSLHLRLVFGLGWY